MSFGKELTKLKNIGSNNITSNTLNSQESLTQRFIRQAKNILGQAEQQLEKSMKGSLKQTLNINFNSFSYENKDGEAIRILGDKSSKVEGTSLLQYVDSGN